jgi:hypothetical protein
MGDLDRIGELLEQADAATDRVLRDDDPGRNQR